MQKKLFPKLFLQEIHPLARKINSPIPQSFSILTSQLRFLK